MSSGGPKLLTQTYVNIRVIREFLNCTIPIEVFYMGPDEMPAHIVDFMQRTFPHTQFIDVLTVKDNIFATAGLNLAGSTSEPTLKPYAMKTYAILLSSFLEVLWLDGDSMPLIDPSFVFDLELYQTTGALLWPELCNARFTKYSSYDVYDIPRPPLDAYQTTKNFWSLSPLCYSDRIIEPETGQMVIHKRKAWQALLLWVFINKNHDIYYHYGFGDKHPDLCFNATGTPFAFASRTFTAVGWQRFIPEINQHSFCKNTYGHLHPLTQEIAFLHASLVKFENAFFVLSTKAKSRPWEAILLPKKDQSWAFDLNSGGELCVHVVDVIGAAKSLPVPENVCLLGPTRLA
jgi:hypothetical protein